MVPMVKLIIGCHIILGMCRLSLHSDYTGKNNGHRLIFLVNSSLELGNIYIGLLTCSFFK